MRERLLNRAIALAPLLVCVLSGAAAQDERPVRKWVADTAHSSVEFRTRHWGIVDIIGWFEDFDVTVYSDSSDFTDAVVEARIRPASVKMPNSNMAANLAMLFDYENHPEAIFKSTGVRRTGENTYEVPGVLTINGVDCEVTLSGTLNGFGYPPDAVPGFTLRTEFDRRLFEVTDDVVDEEASGHPPTIGHTVIVVCNMRLDYAQ